MRTNIYTVPSNFLINIDNIENQLLACIFNWLCITGLTTAYMWRKISVFSQQLGYTCTVKLKLCLKKLQPGDNLINQLSVISTLNHWCLCQNCFSLILTWTEWQRTREKILEQFVCCPGFPGFHNNYFMCWWIIESCGNMPVLDIKPFSFAKT